MTLAGSRRATAAGPPTVNVGGPRAVVGLFVPLWRSQAAWGPSRPSSVAVSGGDSSRARRSAERRLIVVVNPAQTRAR
ncbi:hypothetical protein BMG523Draft_04150 [Frankia sp. BMG5.23]|nr:hypothetical protein BMG523Draft_04150 [Frankia sp. BMG5.23]